MIFCDRKRSRTRDVGGCEIVFLSSVQTTYKKDRRLTGFDTFFTLTISSLSTALLELKNRQSDLETEKNKMMKEKCEKLKKLKLAEYRGKKADMDDKERELCRKTNKLVDDFVSTCDDSPFNQALIEILGNLKGNSYRFLTADCFFYHIKMLGLDLDSN